MYWHFKNQTVQFNIICPKKTFEALIKKNISPEAKGVYTAAAVILGEVAKCETFSAENIQKAITEGLKKVNENKGELKGTVGRFNSKTDNPSTTGSPSLSVEKDGKWEPDDQKCIQACQTIGIIKSGNNTQDSSNIEIKIDLTTKKSDNFNDIYSIKVKVEGQPQTDNQQGVVNKPSKITCPKDFPIKDYVNQLCTEAKTYSGDITIKKLNLDRFLYVYLG